ncbi:hypothetical protein PHLGIDRAFT_28569 [Phlebiopsis gigantea 11061_1 CR5-6]|uniref:Uncharacterized protein n=1 Tax=Phlebiopsis gigantea (strain 11061_1 CR5-6) TaxID=745531 RepID=A0A0C3S3M9_PHLG1|nr:hypothetical protein PHLGIDRAFT_28569 [Phlebiopsis gigantea 11061_1 CR5-6]
MNAKHVVNLALPDTSHPYIYLWDLFQDSLNEPSHVFHGPRENTFVLAFSASKRHLYSGDTDSMIYRYDMTRLSTSITTPVRHTQSFAVHEGDIRSISCHPEQEEVFLSAGEDGKIFLHDGRAENHMTKAQATLQNDSEFTGVQYHPTIPHLLVTGDRAGRAHLRDIRMMFGPLTARSKEGIVHTVGIHIHDLPSIPLIKLSKGSKLAITFLGYLPTIYSIVDPYPIAVCSGQMQPNGDPIPSGERSYSNCCTIKHGSFGGPWGIDDGYYAAGSDDFRAYIWKLPPITALVHEREVVTAQQWTSVEIGTIGFASHMNEKRYIPIELSRPLCRLTGHKSIVNSTAWHPYWPYLVTAGVERHILLHSPTITTPCAADLSLTPEEVRPLPAPNVEDRRRMVRALALGREEDGGDDGLDTIALFDQILRNEGSMDIFASRIYSLDSDDDNSQELEERLSVASP